MALLIPLAWGQQMCLTMERVSSSHEPRVKSNSPIIFDKVSTSGTSTIEQSLVDVSLANITGEIKIKSVVYGDLFYLSVKASRHPRDPNSCPRSSQLFLLVNEKVRQVAQIQDDNMPIGVLNVGDKEDTFEDMDFIKHKDLFR